MKALSHEGPRGQVYRIPLPAGGTFSFTAPFPLSGGDWSYVLSVMEVMKPGLIEEGT